jgi:hypothetical protein
VELLDWELRVVTVAGDDGVFLGFAFFVLHAEGVAFVVYEKDLDLAIATVVLVVGGAVGEDVLVADGVVDLGEDVGERALEHWVKAHAAGHCGEGVELILGLEVVHIGDGCAHAATSAAVHLVKESAGADGKDGDVLGGFDLGENLVEGEFREGVATGGDEDDVLAAFNSAAAIEGLVEGVEEVGLGPGGDDEGLEGLGDGVLVVGEVGEDVGMEVVCHDRDEVIGTQRTEEIVGGVLHIVDEVVAVGGELEQHDGGDGGLGDADAGDGLGDAVFEDQEIVGFEAGDELVGLVEDDVGVDVDDGDVDAEGVGFVVGILDFRLDRGGWGRGRLFGVFLLLEDDGAVVGLRAAVVGRRLGSGLLLGRRSGLGVGARQRKEKGASGEEKDAGRMVRMDSHHLELYSEYWTTLQGDGEAGLGWSGSGFRSRRRCLFPMTGQLEYLAGFVRDYDGL